MLLTEKIESSGNTEQPLRAHSVGGSLPWKGQKWEEDTWDEAPSIITAHSALFLGGLMNAMIF